MDTPMAGTSRTVKDISTRKSYIVADHVRQGKEHIYEPTILPLGPYHYQNHPQLQLVGPLKKYVRDSVCKSESESEKFKKNIGDKIQEIKDFYNGEVKCKDAELIEMMLRDACFLVSHFRTDDANRSIGRRLGIPNQLAMNRDVYKLENQIPLWLISVIDPDQSSLRAFLSVHLYGNETQLSKLPWVEEDMEMPLHLIDAWHTIMFRPGVETETETCACAKRAKQVIGTGTRAINKARALFGIERSALPKSFRDKANNQYRSVTDLKAKGIRFQKSSNFLSDIKFFPSFFRAELRLPSIFINNTTKVLFSNVIAFEMSRVKKTDYPMMSYIIFMKSLIHNADDVKQLRKKSIVYSTFPRDEDVVQIFNDLDTHGISPLLHFNDIRKNIKKHCNSECRTWIADLKNTYFQSPWTFIGFLAAVYLLFLTSAQTYYTVFPRN